MKFYCLFYSHLVKLKFFVFCCCLVFMFSFRQSASTVSRKAFRRETQAPAQHTRIPQCNRVRDDAIDQPWLNFYLLFAFELLNAHTTFVFHTTPHNMWFALFKKLSRDKLLLFVGSVFINSSFYVNSYFDAYNLLDRKAQKKKNAGRDFPRGKNK